MPLVNASLQIISCLEILFNEYRKLKQSNVAIFFNSKIYHLYLKKPQSRDKYHKGSKNRFTFFTKHLQRCIAQYIDAYFMLALIKNV